MKKIGKMMNWRNVEEIAQGLEDNYPEEEIEEVKFTDLEDMVKSLSDFEDHDGKPSREKLNEVLEAWLDLRDSNA